MIEQFSFYIFHSGHIPKFLKDNNTIFGSTYKREFDNNIKVGLTQ